MKKKSTKKNHSEKKLHDILRKLEKEKLPFQND